MNHIEELIYKRPHPFIDIMIVVITDHKQKQFIEEKKEEIQSI